MQQVIYKDETKISPFGLALSVMLLIILSTVFYIVADYRLVIMAPMLTIMVTAPTITNGPWLWQIKEIDVDKMIESRIKYGK